MAVAKADENGISQFGDRVRGTQAAGGFGESAELIRCEPFAAQESGKQSRKNQGDANRGSKVAIFTLLLLDRKAIE